MLSALLPGQSLKAPAIQGAASMVVIKIALETTFDVVDINHPVFNEFSASIKGADAAAADENDWRTVYLIITDHPTE